MQITLEILRRQSADSTPYLQRIPFSYEDPAMTAAAALVQINADPKARDAEGKKVGQIAWECSCLQKKCGACAMRINGVPRLACDCRLSEFAKQGAVLLEPLRKFPVIADLTVDRSVIAQQLLQMQIWPESDAVPDGQARPLCYDAARCLQCGCCLEICPNYCAGGQFFGMSSAVAAARLLVLGQSRMLRAEYRRHVYEGCGLSLACRSICPAGIDIERLLAHAVRRRKKNPEAG